MKTIPSELLNQTVERLQAEFQPGEIYLFGSHAWGTPDATYPQGILNFTQTGSSIYHRLAQCPF